MEEIKLEDKLDDTENARASDNSKNRSACSKLYRHPVINVSVVGGSLGIVAIIIVTSYFTATPPDKDVCPAALAAYASPRCLASCPTDSDSVPKCADTVEMDISSTRDFKPQTYKKGDTTVMIKTRNEVSYETCFCITTKSSPVVCPAKWDARRKCYFTQGAHTSWSNARLTCTNNGGDQVVIEDQNDTDYLLSKNINFNSTTHEGYWLKCKDDVMEGNWTCGSDSPEYWNSDTDKRGLWDWGPGEPDGGMDENCLILDFGGKLRDVPCTLGSSSSSPYNVAACEMTPA